MKCVTHGDAVLGVTAAATTAHQQPVVGSVSPPVEGNYTLPATTYTTQRKHILDYITRTFNQKTSPKGLS